MTLPLTLAEVNALDREHFVAALGWIFEHSPWVAERVWAERPFSSLDALHQAMVKRVAEATHEEQLALLRAHPDLGTRAKLSAASQGEQAGAGLDSLTAEEFERFNVLNAAYRAKFGFPFLFAVKGSTKHDFVLAMQERLLASYEGAFAEALRQVYRIARFRLELGVCDTQE